MIFKVLKCVKLVDHVMVQKKQTNNFYKKFKSFFLKNGDFRSANSLVDKTMLLLAKKYNTVPTRIFLSIFKKLNSFIEVRIIKKKRRTYFVPFAVGLNRRIYLVLKKLKETLILDKRKISFGEKLRHEIFLLLSKEKLSKSLQLKKDNLLKAAQNRSNVHFRW
uniref:Ribosomal protein S7 n=1 Tax=Synura synuroidea TaxID=47573 RepID=Q9MG88_9STRA|nr:ribosomal protein S7 [Synura synuroidea]AAF36961.1 ribosomal protein S7 [Synura synuroidea]